MLAAVIASLVVAGALVASGAASPRSGPTGAAARAELARMINSGLLSPGRRVPGVRNARTGALEQVSYYNWSGYADDDTSGKTYTNVSAKWNEPAVTCPADEDQVAVFWVGLDGFDNSTVEQDGTFAQCYQGEAFYYTWWEMFPSNNIQLVGGTVQAGDKIAASVKFSGGNYTLAVTDSTNTANSFSKSKTCGSGLTCDNASAEWIAETPSYSRGYSPLPNFGTWHVTKAKATGSGTSGTISSFPDDEITIVGTFGEHLGNTGSLNGAGNTFDVDWAYTW